MKIFLDAGHGGTDPGAVGITGLRESDITLRLVQEIVRELAKIGHQVHPSRTNDYAVSLADRAQVANRWQADIFVSIHCNAAADRTAHGYEVWTTRGQTRADPLAQMLLNSIGRAFPNEPARSDVSDGDDDKEADFAVLRLSSMPACLVETGFISHIDTEASMRTPEWISAMSGAIVSGILAGI